MCLYRLNSFIEKAFNRMIIAPSKKCCFGKCGKKVSIGAHARFIGIKNIICHDNISIGSNCLFICTRANIIIKNHVMFAPNVVCITGGHRYDVVGRYMDTITDDEKNNEIDKNIIFEGDNWVGANSVILKGVTVGKGAVVGAGSVVTKDVPNYSIVAGNPARVIKYRFTENDVKEHKKLIGEDKNETL